MKLVRLPVLLLGTHFGENLESSKSLQRTEKDPNVDRCHQRGLLHHVGFPRPRHLHVFLQEMRGLGHRGQQGAAAVRAGVPVAGPGAVLPLPLPRRGAPAAPAPAPGRPARRLLRRPGRPASRRLLLGQIPARGGKYRAARGQEVQKRNQYFRNHLNRSSCLSIDIFSK